MNKFKNCKISCLFLSLLFLASTISAQKFYNSSEFRKFDIEKKALNKLNRDSVFIFIESWENMAKLSGDSIALAYVWMRATRLCTRLHEKDRAIHYGINAQRIIDNHSLTGEFTLNKSFLANGYAETGQYEKSIKLALESIEDFNIYYPYENRSNYFVLSISYLYLKNYPRMDYYLQKWYALVKEKNIRVDLGYSIYQIYWTYDKAGMYEQASYFLHEYYKFYSDHLDDNDDVPEHAHIPIAGESTKEKIDKLHKYLLFHEQNDRLAQISITNRNLGGLYYKIGMYESAAKHFEYAVQHTEHEGLENQLTSILGLSNSYKSLGKFEKALTNSNLYITILDSLKNKQVIAQANELEVKYQNEKKEIQLELQETQIRTKNNWLLFSSLVGLILLVLSAFIYGLNKKLKSKNRTISDTLSEKETLLQEIHHRVKNNLQVISSLLSLQSKYVKDKVAISALNEGQNRVEAMALIHQNLYREDNISGVDMKKYIPLLADSIFNSYNIKGEEVQIQYDLGEITLDVSSVIPIGLVLNELISNALKHAFPKQKDGLLKVSLQEQSNNLLLSVVDNGVGTEQVNTGFGSKLIRSFTRKLEGELKVTSDNGTAVELLIKNFKRA